MRVKETLYCCDQMKCVYVCRLEADVRSLPQSLSTVKVELTGLARLVESR